MSDLPGQARRLVRGLVGAIACQAFLTAGMAEEPKSAPDPGATTGTTPSDWRLQPLKDLDGYFPFTPSDTADAWATRAEERRLAMRVALGLWPMPEPTPLEAVVHGKWEGQGYTIEKAYFQSLPGFYVTGNLYRPAGDNQAAGGKHPAVLSPHGHFRDGRFGDQGREAVRREIVQGAERFEDGGRNQLQSRAVQLARMGCVVFLYDMIGYCDSQQLSQALVHGFARQRSEMISSDRWGLFSPQAESMLQSVMGLQAYNAIRALDFLSELPDVDPTRIAVTGASGGGTQTFILGAIDPRPTVLVPAVMVSTAMQGGCTCENASLLRVGTGNVEFAALIAPRPLCLISANDWTREMPEKGFPELKQHYQLLGVADRLEHYPLLHFGHNYNYVSRSAMYQFLNRHLQLGLESPVIEEDYQRLTAAELSVWDDQHPQPPSGPTFERELLQTWAADAQRQLDQHKPLTAQTWEGYDAIVRPGWETILRRELPRGDRLEYVPTERVPIANGLQIVGTLIHRPVDQDAGLAAQQETIPATCLLPTNWEQGPAAIWLDAQGQQGLYADDGTPRTEVQQLLDAGVAVVGADLLEQGTHRSGEQALEETRRVANPREAAAYTHGYNDALFAQRVHDVLSLIGYAVGGNELVPSQIWLYGQGEAAAWAAAALAIAQPRIDQAAISTDGFRFLQVNSIRSPKFLPGGAKYDDLPGLLTLAAPTRLRLSGEKATDVELVQQAYRARGPESQLTLQNEPDTPQAAVQWLLEGR